MVNLYIITKNNVIMVVFISFCSLILGVIALLNANKNRALQTVLSALAIILSFIAVAFAYIAQRVPGVAEYTVPG